MNNIVPGSFVALSDFHSYSYPVDKIVDYYLDEYETIYILGDATDRGPEQQGSGGIEVLSRIKDLSEKTNGRVVYIPGNHDEFLYNYGAHNSSFDMMNLQYNQGAETINEFETLRKRDPRKAEELMEWLGNLPLQRKHEFDNKKYALAHAFFNERLYNEIPEFSLKQLHYLNNSDMRLYDYVKEIVWFRKKAEGFYYKEDVPSSDTTIVIGHTPETHRQGQNLDLENASGETVKVHCVDGGIAYKNGGMLKYDGGWRTERTTNFDHKDTSPKPKSQGDHIIFTSPDPGFEGLDEESWGKIWGIFLKGLAKTSAAHRAAQAEKEKSDLKRAFVEAYERLKIENPQRAQLLRSQLFKDTPTKPKGVTPEVAEFLERLKRESDKKFFSTELIGKVMEGDLEACTTLAEKLRTPEGRAALDERIRDPEFRAAIEKKAKDLEFDTENADVLELWDMQYNRGANPHGLTQRLETLALELVKKSSTIEEAKEKLGKFYEKGDFESLPKNLRWLAVGLDHGAVRSVLWLADARCNPNCICKAYPTAGSIVSSFVNETIVDHTIYSLEKRFGSRQEAVNQLSGAIHENDYKYITDSVGNARTIAKKLGLDGIKKNILDHGYKSVMEYSKARMNYDYWNFGYSNSSPNSVGGSKKY